MQYGKNWFQILNRTHVETDKNGYKFWSVGVAFYRVVIDFWPMRFTGLVLVLLVITGCGTVRGLSRTSIIKVLPHYLDNEGQHTDGPTLLHRDAYQRKLRTNPDLVHGVRYDVNWRGKGEVTLRLELRSSKSKPMTVEQKVGPGLIRTQWTPILLDAKTYRSFGQPEAWRVSIWQGEEMLGEQLSFLW